jgi:hypothetical protein
MVRLTITETTAGAAEREPLRVDDPDFEMGRSTLSLGLLAANALRAYLGPGFGNKFTKVEVDGRVFEGCTIDADPPRRPAPPCAAVNCHRR